MPYQSLPPLEPLSGVGVNDLFMGSATRRIESTKLVVMLFGTSRFEDEYTGNGCEVLEALSAVSQFAGRGD